MSGQMELVSARTVHGPDPVPNLAAADRIVFSNSGGKDSIVAMDEGVRLADAAGVRDRIVVLHIDLGRTPRGHSVEWPDTADLARRQADYYGLPFAVRRMAKWPSLFHRIRARGQFPHFVTRFCTSEKRVVAHRFITEQVNALGVTGCPARILHIVGFRAEESRARARRPALEVDRRASNGRRTVTQWYPVLRWCTPEVWQRIRERGLPYHWAYDAGMSRAVDRATGRHAAGERVQVGLRCGTTQRRPNQPGCIVIRASRYVSGGVEMTGSREPRSKQAPECGTYSTVAGSTAADIVQARDINGGVHFHRPAPEPPPIPRQLPGAVGGFFGRATELELLDTMAAGPEVTPPVVVIAAIAGTAGVGKSSLAVRWAHLVRDRFPDGQLYVNLRGFDPNPPLSPEQVLEGFLQALGVPAAGIPVDLESRAGLYRSLLGERRMLVLLDNAATTGQVRPLLPGSPSCLALVTSRNRLSGLVARDGAHRLSLDVLPENEALALLQALTARSRTQDDPAQWAELARLCAYLPLALRIVAQRAADHPFLPLADLVRDLRDASTLWQTLTDDEETETVHAVFAWSYRALPPPVARLFRRLGLHPGPDFSSRAAAALAGADIGQTQRMVDALIGAYLLEQTGPDRYQFHDLLRAFAYDRAHAEEELQQRDAAVQRIVLWYLHTAAAAQKAIAPGFRPTPLDAPLTNITPIAFTDPAEAMRWCDIERANLLGAARAAATAGLDHFVWRFPVALQRFHMRRKPMENWFTLGEVGLAAARRLDDLYGQAEILNSLGVAYINVLDLTASLDNHEQALAIRRQIGDRYGEGVSLNNLGFPYLRGRRFQEARSCFEQAVSIARQSGDRDRESISLSNLALVHIEMGEAEEAVDLLLEGTELSRIHDDNVLLQLSKAFSRIGRGDEALDSAQRVLTSKSKWGIHVEEAYPLAHVGNALRALGRLEEGLAALRQAAELLHDFGDPRLEAEALDDAGRVCQDLGDLDAAIDFYGRVVDIHRRFGARWQSAFGLNHLATALHRVGRQGEASRAWQEALPLLASFNDRETVELRAQIQHALDTGSEDL
ncbi:tetratricopeptide repeat protein [Streptomyces malaysiensis]|uniref:tetratricopeptide repeat protein n=1 Tax=Streptomyces malaysiensis TaxID=92644 RepID=UPI0036AB271B